MPKIFDLIRESPSAWRWWLRLHPCRLHEREEIRSVLTERGLHNVLLDQATDLPLYALLRHMDVHLTEWSSVLLEAESFGVPSVVTHPGADLAFSPSLPRDGDTSPDE
jgi:sugar phosphate isomerase/epimerase